MRWASTVNLLTQLQDLQTQPGRTFSGKSGSLYLDQSNRLHRLLAWADMENGTAKISGYAPRMERPSSRAPAGDTPRSGDYLAPQAGGLPPVIDRRLPPPDTRP
ncbi:MAG: hypothetical protein ABW092_15720 [Candidatus Thiodiazotropha sp.]